MSISDRTFEPNFTQTWRKISLG